MRTRSLQLVRRRAIAASEPPSQGEYDEENEVVVYGSDSLFCVRCNAMFGMFPEDRLAIAERRCPKCGPLEQSAAGSACAVFSIEK
jgi:hypothetical protein